MRTLALSVAMLLAAGCAPADDEAADNAVVENAPVSEPAQVPPATLPSQNDDRRAAILESVRSAEPDLTDKARVALAFADIGGDPREEALVYLVDPMLCGTGGCSLIVLTPSGKAWRELARTSVTQLPVHRLLTSRQGWNDLAVGISGGGAAAGIAVLRFDKGRYPSNPSVEPKLNRLPEGARELIADDYDKVVPIGSVD